eukprot:1137031-Pelagomonas_calceolata.AAC.6
MEKQALPSMECFWSFKIPPHVFVPSSLPSREIHTTNVWQGWREACAFQIKMQIPGDRKGRAMNRQGYQRECHPVMILGKFIRVFTMFCQGISIPHTSQPFSQINNKLPHDHRQPREGKGRVT